MFCFYFFNLYVFCRRLLTFSSLLPASILVYFMCYSRAQFSCSSSDTLTHTHSHIHRHMPSHTFTPLHTHIHTHTLKYSHTHADTQTLTAIHRYSQKLYTLTLTHIKHRHACFNLCRLFFFIFFLFLYLSLWVIPFVKTFNDVIKSLTFFSLHNVWSLILQNSGSVVFFVFQDLFAPGNHTCLFCFLINSLTRFYLFSPCSSGSPSLPVFCLISMWCPSLHCLSLLSNLVLL